LILFLKQDLTRNILFLFLNIAYNLNNMYDFIHKLIKKQGVKSGLKRHFENCVQGLFVATDGERAFIGSYAWQARPLLVPMSSLLRSVSGVVCGP
jgi:hypothetical protein